MNIKGKVTLGEYKELKKQEIFQSLIGELYEPPTKLDEIDMHIRAWKDKYGNWQGIFNDGFNDYPHMVNQRTEMEAIQKTAEILRNAFPYG